MMHLDIRQSEVANQSAEKGDRLAPRLDERERDIRVDQAKRDAGDARPRSDVQNSGRPARQERPEEQRVEEKSLPDLRSRLERCEVMCPVPDKK
jgi:hypothetical protein